VYQQTVCHNSYILPKVTTDMNDTRAIDDWFRAHPVVWFLMLATFTGSLYGIIHLLFGESMEYAVVGGVIWGVGWAGAFFAFRHWLSE
jgi:hypothetical protein